MIRESGSTRVSNILEKIKNNTPTTWTNDVQPKTAYRHADKAYEIALLFEMKDLISELIYTTMSLFRKYITDNFVFYACLENCNGYAYHILKRICDNNLLEQMEFRMSKIREYEINSEYIVAIMYSEFGNQFMIEKFKYIPVKIDAKDYKSYTIHIPETCKKHFDFAYSLLHNDLSKEIGKTFLCHQLLLYLTFDNYEGNEFSLSCYYKYERDNFKEKEDDMRFPDDHEIYVFVKPTQNLYLYEAEVPEELREFIKK